MGNSDKIAKYVTETYPLRKLQTDVNYLLGYYLALVKLTELKLLNPTHTCLLIKETLYNECIQANFEVFDLTLFASQLGESDLASTDPDKFDFLVIWLNEIAIMYNPVRAEF